MAMLSAIAARKARLDGKQVQLLPAPIPSSAKPLQTAPTEQPTPTPVPTKRKPSEQTSKPQKKKRKKQLKAVQARYFEFEDDTFKTQQDVIMVDDNSHNSDEASASESSFLDVAGDLEVPVHEGLNPQTKTRRRPAWSPSAPLRDSSSEDEGGQDGMEVALPMPVAGTSREVPAVPSTFEPVIDKNTFTLTQDEVLALALSSQDIGTLLVLSPPDTLALVGTYRLTVLQGAISLMGTTLFASRASHRIFAPRSSPIPVLRIVPSSNHGTGLTLPLRVRQAADLTSVAVILLQDMMTGIERLGLVCPTFEGNFSLPRSLSRAPSSGLMLGSAQLLKTHTSNMLVFQMPPSWEASINTVLDNVTNGQDSRFDRRVYLVKGPKNAGKSTFARVLMNSLLTRYRRIAFLEGDLGQSEFTPAGMAAINIVDAPLFGPSFTHPSIPHTAHFVGATSPKSCPSHYLECIQALVNIYNLDLQHSALLHNNDQQGTDDKITDVVPLVVNTMGWTRGLGYDLSTRIEEMVEPSLIFELGAPLARGANATFPAIGGSLSRTHISLSRVFKEEQGKLCPIEAVILPAATQSFTGVDHRILSVLSYFYAVFSDALSSSGRGSASGRLAQMWDVSLPLCAKLPYEVDCKTAFDHIILTGASAEDVVPSEIGRVMNGAVVGLTEWDTSALDSASSEERLTDTTALPYVQGAPPPPPPSSTCRGLALVRSVSHSPEGTLMHVLTPIPPEELSHARVLVKGELELPIWGMLDFRSTRSDIAGVEHEKVPFLKWGRSEGAGAEKRRVRRNIMRRGQM